MIAGQATESALALLRDCAPRPDERLRPSKVADIHHFPKPGGGSGDGTQCHQGCHDSP